MTLDQLDEAMPLDELMLRMALDERKAEELKNKSKG